MTVKRLFELWFPMWFPNKALEELKATPDRTPDLLRVFAKDIEGLRSGCLTLLSKIQKLEHRVSQLETTEGR